VWEFDVHVVLSVAKSLFKSHSVMSWNEFERAVLKHLDGAVLLVQLGYRFSGDTGKMLYLKNDTDWADALHRLDVKVPTVHKNAVSFEVQNLVSFIAITYQKIA
jgi:hypothetical protein